MNGVGVGERAVWFRARALSSPLLVARDFRGVGVGVGLFPRCEMERPTRLKKSPNVLPASSVPPSAKVKRQTKRTNLGTMRMMDLAPG